MSTHFESQRSVLSVQSPGNPPPAPNTTVAVDHECSCTLQLHPHRIADDEWAAHRAEWEAKKATEAAAPAAAATEDALADPASASTMDEKVLVRWLELARLPYWDDIEPAVVDTLNNLPEGLPACWTRVAQRGSKQ
ncbi:hypothetical protein C8R45DRAFT_1103597 [Mycena sanguinolenta]|nr:hypothetical protein C8R45DRAFT_1103597 [Mycena sanguinolenta]